MIECELTDKQKEYFKYFNYEYRTFDYDFQDCYRHQFNFDVVHLIKRRYANLPVDKELLSQIVDDVIKVIEALRW